MDISNFSFFEEAQLQIFDNSIACAKNSNLLVVDISLVSTKTTLENDHPDHDFAPYPNKNEVF